MRRAAGRIRDGHRTDRGQYARRTGGHLDVSKPSVCHAVATLKEGGFLTMDEDSFLHLTDVGREVAERTYEKHCFFIRLLVDAGVEPKTAEQDACRMEHAISDDSFQKIKSGLKDK